MQRAAALSCVAFVDRPARLRESLNMRTALLAKRALRFLEALCVRMGIRLTSPLKIFRSSLLRLKEHLI